MATPEDRNRRGAAASEEADRDAESGPRAVDGRVPGRRGRATRRRLLECTRALLETTSYRDLKVVDIAREAGTSPATFYQYFPDVDAAILALAQEMGMEGRSLALLVRDKSWKGKAGYATATQLVDGVLDFWESNRSVLRVVDLLTEEGDIRFRKIRTRLLNELAVALGDVIVAARGQRSDDVDPMATAGVLVSMLAHVAAHRWGFEFWGIRTDDTRTAMARIVYTSVTNGKPPAGV